ncbi:MAG: citramalate synthase [Spirochaetaceae bacterium]|jgi:2-isopropylmalate synthase|nr:citramalate synthase [Spirochaetaceae bacterium]
MFDTTLRDGAQGAGISFSVQDKLAIIGTLDELGLSWIEAGNPGSNPKDSDFFRSAKKIKLRHAVLCAFGSTRKKNLSVKDDAQIASLLSAETETITLFGKSSALHVKDVLKASLEENLDMIAETISFLRAEGRNVIYDAEHFFDGWKLNGEYALKTLRTAFFAGAQRIILCDTNGGSFPNTIREGFAAVNDMFEAEIQSGGGKPPPSLRASVTTLPPSPGGSAPKPPNRPILGIHAHNDMGLALACSLTALEAGCTHVQGTLLGFGERCGNTPLAALIPSIELKLGQRCLPEGRLERLSELSRRVAEISNINVQDQMPYIGSQAFSHKAGMHADGVLKASASFEHISPALVGNVRHFLMSEQGGRSAIVERLRLMGENVDRDSPLISKISRKLKELESGGWQFEGADASFEILARKMIGSFKSRFSVLAYRAVSEHPSGEKLECCYAWAKVLVEGQTEIAAAEGDGPVNAMDGALRRALSRFFPVLKEIRLSDYKVRVIDGNDATAAQVRVLIESSDGASIWTTVGVSTDIIEASCIALVDAIEYKLNR